MVFEFSFREPLDGFTDVFLPDLQVIRHNESLDREPSADNDRHAAWPGLQLLVVVAGDHAAERNAAELPHIPKHRFEDLTTNVFKVDVDTVGTDFTDTFRQRLALTIIEGSVVTELCFEQIHLVIGTRTTRHGATMQFGELADHAADRAGGRRHENGLAGLRLADGVQPDIRGHAGHAENAEVVRQRCRAFRHFVQPGSVTERVVLPAKHAADKIALRIVLVATGDYLADNACLQHFPDLKRRYIGFRLVHASAHVGIDGHEDVADQQLPLSHLRYRFFGQREIVGRYPARWPAREPNLFVHFHVNATVSKQMQVYYRPVTARVICATCRRSAPQQPPNTLSQSMVFVIDLYCSASSTGSPSSSSSHSSSSA